MDERDQALSEEGRARRRFLKQAGAVAWGAPLIVTMMSRAALAQPGCGTQTAPNACNITTPCGSPALCAPDPDNLGIGNPCICVPS
ncbi:MAG: hypothetical protein ABR613_12985 [Actinomycetota bacterium]